MKRTMRLAGACMLGGLMVVAVASGLRAPARAAEVTAPQAGAEEQERLLNPGFEDATGSLPDCWTSWGGTLTQVNSPVHTGSYAARLESTTTSTKWVYQVVTVTEEAVYVFSAWAVKDDAHVEEVYLRVSWYASDNGYGTMLSQDDSTTRLTTDDPAYQFLTTGPITAPTDAHSVQVRMMLNPADGTTCAATYDDASFQRVGAPQPPADLSVAKSGPATISAGQLITYRIALSNAGTLTATDAVLTDTLPAAVDFVSQASPFTFDYAGRDLVWQLGHVPTSIQHLITVTGRVTDTASGALTNLITATTTASEMVTANNTAGWTTTVTGGGIIYLPLIFRNNPATWPPVHADLR